MTLEYVLDVDACFNNFNGLREKETGKLVNIERIYEPKIMKIETDVPKEIPIEKLNELVRKEAEKVCNYDANAYALGRHYIDVKGFFNPRYVYEFPIIFFKVGLKDEAKQ